jgi:hypothetical protein
VRSHLLLAVLLLFACHGTCNNEVYTSEKAPDKKHWAAKFVRSCGSDEPTTNVSVIRRWAPLAGGPNAFSCNAAVDDVTVWWAANDRLHISYPEKATVFERAARVGSVAIEYVRRPPTR